MSPTPIFFRDAAGFGAWLAEHHANATEVLVGFYKKGTGRQNMTWSESVDEALCYGWIDGVRRSLDDDSYVIRFTPRKPSSTWSAVNVKKVEALIAAGRMRPAGLAAYDARREDKTAVYSFESEPKDLPDGMVKLFRRNKQAWAFFERQPPGYRRTAIHWVVSAKRSETQARRLTALIDASASGSRLF